METKAVGSIFDETNDTALRRYLAICNEVTGLDSNASFQLAKDILYFVNHPQEVTPLSQRYQEIEKDWYDSVASGKPDYSHYGNDDILIGVWWNWILYSRKYLLALRSRTDLLSAPIKTIVDLGCGCSYSTAALKEIFEGSSVFGTNIETTNQYRVCKRISEIYGFSVVPGVKELPREVDFLFASEYFEHWQDPVSHLCEIIQHCAPRHFYLANAFGGISVGHFPRYKHLNRWVSNRQIGRIFNKVLFNEGYRQVETGFWNNRPALWRKQ